jgi:predicted acetyltransferase
MQVKVLDHGRLLRAMHLPEEARGEAIVAVRETEGHVSKFRLRIEGGRADVTPTDASADVEMTDVTWAAVALGEMRADAAERWGLLDVSDAEAVRTLNALSVGPVPFCEEYF